MAGLGLEIVKMTLYIFFPVGLFLYFNVPSTQEKETQGWRKEYQNTQRLPRTFKETRAMAEKFMADEK